MLQDEFTSVCRAQSRSELLRDIVGFAGRLGFDTASAMTVVDDDRGDARFICLGNTPLAYRQGLENMSHWRRDPVLQHCKRTTVPIIWNQDTYAAAGLGEIWEFQARFGYRTGISLALHPSEQRHFVMGISRRQPLPGSSAELTRIVADLLLFATYAQDAALRVLLPESISTGHQSNLTPRELESLRWTKEGKTAWELGRILGISEQTAARHVHNATKKLDCVNKLQAVLKALQLGLMH